MGWQRVVFCGDDFGMNTQINAGMLHLALLGRLSAISCLAHGPVFATHGPDLRAMDLDLGLHLNLTEAIGPANPPVMPLRTLIARAYAGRLDDAWLDEQMARQFDAFEAVIGRAPDYVDGHQHVHQLPGVLPRLVRLMRRRYGRRAWLRHTAPCVQQGIPVRDAIKAHFIGALGSGALARLARQEGLCINRRLAGVYGLEGGARRYAMLLRRWLQNAQDGDLLVCHPALAGASDPLAPQRAAELQVLASPALGDLLQLNRICVARLSRTYPATSAAAPPE